MPTVHLTITDTPTGGVAVHSDFQPAVGKACSPAQAAALEIFNRTRRDWGMPQGEASKPGEPPTYAELHQGLRA